MDGGGAAQIFDRFNIQLRQDFLERGMDSNQSLIALLQELQSSFVMMGASLHQFGLPDLQLNKTSSELELFRREMEIKRYSYTIYVQENLPKLSLEQRNFFEKVCTAVFSGNSTIFFWMQQQEGVKHLS